MFYNLHQVCCGPAPPRLTLPTCATSPSEYHLSINTCRFQCLCILSCAGHLPPSCNRLRHSSKTHTRRRPDGPPNLAINPFTHPAKFFGCSPHWGFTKVGATVCNVCYLCARRSSYSCAADRPTHTGGFTNSAHNLPPPKNSTTPQKNELLHARLASECGIVLDWRWLLYLRCIALYTYLPCAH